MATHDLANDVEKNAHLVAELDHLLTKQQLLIARAFHGGMHDRNKRQNATRSATLRRTGPLPTGCKVRMWKQDPSVASVGVRTVYLPNEVEAGPRDSAVVMRLEADQKIKTPVEPDGNGDMLLSFDENPFAFDLVQVYSVVRMIVNMYERDLQVEWRWQWDREKPGASRIPLQVNCHAGVKQNAAYVRSKKLMKFYYFHDDDSNKDIFLCRSLDIVAHETGHAVMDALKPKLYYIKKGQEGAIHESFADLTAIFTVLSMMDLCEDVVANTKGDLRATRYLSGIGEQFGKALEGDDEPAEEKGDPEEPGESHNSVARGVRNANNDLKGSQVKEVYDISQVFTGYVFDILCDVFNHERNPRMRDDAETLFSISRVLRRVLLLAIFSSPEVPNFMDVSKAMEKAVDIIASDDAIDVAYWVECVVKYRLERELDCAGKEEKELDLGGDW